MTPPIAPDTRTWRSRHRRGRPLKALPDVCASTAAACTSASLERSHVLRALGHDPAAVVGSVRFSLGRTTTEDEVERAVRRILDGFQRMTEA